MTRQRILTYRGKGIPVRGNDIDTDRIIPARFMKCVTFEGLGAFAFHDVRFDAEGNQKQHPMNEARFKNGSVLVVNKNFGCGSSREHAPQALQKYGIQALIGESFAEIFAGNCNAMGIICATAAREDIAAMQAAIEAVPDSELDIDVDAQKIQFQGTTYTINIPVAFKNGLTQGTWDTVGILAENLPKIREKANQLEYMKK